jgi:putative oxidoreductase
MNDAALLLLRIAYAALLLAFHGASRFGRAADYVIHGESWPFVDVVTQLNFPMAPVFAVASALSESLGAAVIAAGLWTRPAAAIIALNMSVAIYNEARKGDSIELAALYLLGATWLLVVGPGKASLDRLRSRGRFSARRSSRERYGSARA